MNFIFTNGNFRQVQAYARTRVVNLLEQGIKDSTVFCLGENKHHIEPMLRKYVDAITNELGGRGYQTNPKAHYQVRRLYLQLLSERISSIANKKLGENPNFYDVFKITVGAGMDGIPALFASFYPVDSQNIDGDYVQPEYTLRVPLIYGNHSVFRNRMDNKAPVTLFGISEATLIAVRHHLDRLKGLPLDQKTAPKDDASNDPTSVVDPEDDPVPMVDPREQRLLEVDDDSIPSNINHAATIVDTIRRRTASA